MEKNVGPSRVGEAFAQALNDQAQLERTSNVIGRWLISLFIASAAGIGLVAGIVFTRWYDSQPQPTIEVDAAMRPESWAGPTAVAWYEDGVSETFPVNAPWTPPRKVVEIMVSTDLQCWIRIDGKLVAQGMHDCHWEPK